MPNSEGKKRPVGRIETMQKRKRKQEYTRANVAGVESMKGSDSTQEGKYRMLVQNIPCAVYSAYPGKTGPTTFMSNKWKDWTGYSPEELYRNPEVWAGCIHPDDREHTVNTYIHACRDRVAYNLEYRIIHKDKGQLRYVKDQGHLSTDEEGAVVRIDGIITDITELKKANDELDIYRNRLEDLVKKRTAELTSACETLKVENKERERSEQVLSTADIRFRSLIEQTTDAVFCYEYDPPIPTDLPLEQQVRLLYDGVLVECNDVCAKSYGADRAEEVVGRRLTELFGARPGSLDELFTEMIEGGYRTVDGEGVERLEDGTERYFLNNGHGVIEGGKLIRVWGTFRDITERKRTQDVLRETTNLLETIFGHTHMLVACLDPQFNFVRVNRTYAEADEHQPSFFHGKNHFDLYPNEENEVIFRRVVETGIPYFAYAKSFEYTEHPERGISYWDWSLVPIKNQQGVVSGLVFTLADVTARERAEESLKASEGKLNAMLQSISDHMSMMDKDLNIIWANDIAKRMFGDDIIGKKCYEVYHGRQNPCEPFPCLTLKAFQDGKVHEHDTHVVDKDGNTRYFHCNANVALRDLEGKPTAVLEVSRDITDQKSVEQALRESENSYRAVVENTAEGIVVAQGQTLQFVNPAALSMFGYSKEELLTRPFIEFIHPEHRDWAMGIHIKRINGEEVPPVYELKVLDKKGNTIWLENNGILIEWRGKPATLNFLRDVTERKKAEQAIWASESEKRSILNAISDHIIFHDTDLLIRWGNEVAARSIGMTQRELVGRHCYELWQARSEPCERCPVIGAIETGSHTEAIMTTPDGKCWEIIGEPVLDRDGQIRGAIEISRDITERVLAEQALKESEIKFRSITEESLVGVYVIQDGVFKYINPKFAEIFGYSVDELINKKRPDELIHPDDWPASKENLRKRIAGELKSIQYVFRGITKNQEVIHVEVYGSGAEYEGRPAVIGTLLDITERVLAEQALQESEEHFRAIFENALAGLYRTTPDGRILMANPALVQMLGYSSFEELAQLNLEKEGFSRDCQRSVFKQRVEAEDRIVGLESRWMRRDGTTLFVSESARAVRDKDGEILYYEGTVVDLTERKMAEQALRESEEKFRLMFELSPFSTVLSDLEGNIKACNQQFVKMHATKEGPDAQVGKSVLEFFPEEERSFLFSTIKKMIGEKKNQGTLEFTMLREDGTRFPAGASSTIVMDKDGQPQALLAIAQDISQSKCAEQKLVEYQSQLKSLASQLSLTEERERRRLATELHDQIGQSLVISKIKLDQLRKSSASDEFNKPLEDICNCLGRIIDDTRALTFDLSYPILYELGFEAAVAEWLTDEIKEKHGIEAEFVDDGHEKPLDDDICVLLFRNVRELLINVVKHAGAHKVRVMINKVNEHINVSVEDDGVGFDSVEVASMATKKAAFGLFSIRERLEQLGGLIEIDSKPGHGSKITMIAPLKYHSLSDRTLQ